MLQLFHQKIQMIDAVMIRKIIYCSLGEAEMFQIVNQVYDENHEKVQEMSTADLAVLCDQKMESYRIPFLEVFQEKEYSKSLGRIGSRFAASALVRSQFDEYITR